MTRILGKLGESKFLLGNEAIARGVIEAGVGYVSSYPGTPSTEIVESLAEAAKELGIHVEWGTNEIVAYESAFAASLTGVRAFFAAKHVGINVAADAVISSAYIGTNSGFVFVSADDPYSHSSQNEQDNRNYSRHFGLITLEPSTPQEGKDMAIKGYEISEAAHLPVMLRTTTRISHSRSIVKFGPIREPKTKGQFEKNPSRYVIVPAAARRNKLSLLKRLKKAKELANQSKLNFVKEVNGKSLDKKLGIITSGVAYLYSFEEAKKLGYEMDIMKIGFSYPLPDEQIAKFIEDKDEILIIEEIDPILEKEVKALAHDRDFNVEIHGKDILPNAFELRPKIVERGLKIFLGLEKGKIEPMLLDPPSEIDGVKIPNRPPVLCPGCPHRASYYAVYMALKRLRVKAKAAIFPTDIGCMTLGTMPPYLMGDILLAMGSSLGTSAGLSAVTDQPVIPFIGDSTFFHAGMPGLVNAIYNKHPIILVVLDNDITAMTGFQPDPSTGLNAMGDKAKAMKISEIARALGADFVAEVDPVMEWERARDTFMEAWKTYQNGGVAVVVYKSPCALYSLRAFGKTGHGGRYRITEKCVDCGLCYKYFNCPAIIYDEEKKRPYIRDDLCTGCGVCVEVCPIRAIERTPD